MKARLFLLITALLLLAACSPASNPGQPETLTVVTHDSFSVSEKVIAAFEQENNARVVFLKSGDAGAALNKAILTKGAPLGDVFFGVDNTFLSRALEEDLFLPYTSPLLAAIPAEFKLDGSNRATPVDYGDVCINYDIAWFESRGLKVPQTLEALADPAYKDLLVVENPATSSPGLAFLLATIAHFGEAGYLDYWQQLKENGVVIANDWNSAYYTSFSGSSGKGSQPMVVSYASSPAAEVIFADPPRHGCPHRFDHGKRYLLPPGRICRNPEGDKARAARGKIHRFSALAIFPGRYPFADVHVPGGPPGEAAGGVHQVRAELPVSRLKMDPQIIASNRDKWIRAWSQVMLP